MHLPAQLANHIRQVYFGGNWTSVNLKDVLTGLSWQQATTEVYSLNTIAKLVFHINYYVRAVMKVLQGGPLDAHDQFSFDLPPVRSVEDWENLVARTWVEAEDFAGIVDQFPESGLDDIFADKKYGTYRRNIIGVIEHCHYHLGQIVLIKKIIQTEEAKGKK